MSTLQIGLMFGVATFIALFSGMPIAFAVGGVALVFMLLYMPAPTVAVGLSAAAAAGAAIGGTALLVLLLSAWLRRRLGGYTGDTLGACEQLGEVSVLLALSAARCAA